MTEEHVEIDYKKLSKEALQGLVEAYILRDGTDYGFHEVSLEQKVQQVKEMLRRREAKIVFDPETESANIIVSKTTL